MWVSSIIIIENGVSESHGRQKKSLRNFLSLALQSQNRLPSHSILISTAANLAPIFSPPSIIVKIMHPDKENAETQSNTEPGIGIL